MANALYDFLMAVVTGVTVAAAIALGSFHFNDEIHAWLVSQDPSCADPGDLKPLGAGDLQAEGRSQENNEASDAVDGYDGSWWVPELQSPRAGEDRDTWHVSKLNTDEATRTLTLRLQRTEDVRLICVVDGLAESEARYQMHGSVASATVWGDSGHRRTHALSRLTADRMQVYQEAGGPLGTTSSVHIRIDDVFAGHTVESFDPDDCHRYATNRRESLPDGETAQERDAVGCIRAPVPAAGIAEVLLYVRN